MKLYPFEDTYQYVDQTRLEQHHIQFYSHILFIKSTIDRVISKNNAAEKYGPPEILWIMKKANHFIKTKEKNNIVSVQLMNMLIATLWAKE